AGNALGFRILEHLRYPRMGAQLEAGLAQRDRDHGDVRAALGVRLAAEALAEAAVLAGAELRAVRIGIGTRRIRRWPRERVIAELARGVGEHLARQDRRKRRQRVIALPR